MIKKSLESELYGGNSNLDYSDFINFMSKIEKKFEEKSGEKIEIFNKISFFRTLSQKLICNIEVSVYTIICKSIFNSNLKTLIDLANIF